MRAVVTLAEEADPKHVRAELQGLGLWPEPHQDEAGRVTQLVVAPPSREVDLGAIRALSGVVDVATPASPHPELDARAGRAVTLPSPAASSEEPEHPPRLALGPGQPPVLAAGPCSVESPEQIRDAAARVAAAGGRLLRGGAYKPRTSPYKFDGHGPEALRWLREAADEHGLAVVTEVMSEADVDRVAAWSDLLQVGSRSMQHFPLLHAIGRSGRPALLKRGRAATVKEWRLAAEHLLAAGASDVILCERGVVGIEPETRDMLDLGAVALVSRVDGLPVVVDPSHATGRRDLVPHVARAALEAGAHGILVETHPDAREAKSDGPQALAPDELRALGADLGVAGSGA